jgi:GNAT superfamily N-acetyltransferase
VLIEAMGKTDTRQAVRARFNGLLRSGEHALLVALVDGMPIGYAWAQDRGAHLRSGSRTVRLHDLFVLPSYRRRGIGAKLFESAKQWAHGRHARWMEWQASRGAVAFYDRLGLRGDPCPDPKHPFFEIDFGGP